MLAPLVMILSIVKSGFSCSPFCPDGEGLCLDNVEGNIGADCTGLVGCWGWNQTCMGECPQENPVLSEDGLSCSACDAAGDDCPQCSTEEFWCGAEKECKKKTSQCNGGCPLLLYPVFTPDGECLPCSGHEQWCAPEQRCLDSYTEACNGECQHWTKRFCNETSTCMDNDAPCGDQCESYYTFCTYSQTCNYEHEPCGGVCAPHLRLCGDRCISEDRPCNATCPPDLQYCMLSYSCLQSHQTCPCPPDTWGCCMYQAEDGSITNKYQPDQQCQQQCDLADTDTNPTYPCIVEMRDSTSWSTFWLTVGKCHPKFVKDSSGLCAPWS
eukprot:GFUD01080836.1.p1 GENE.GFUD01080836.1~~GFUD01080836.1.p1  ORF type:complete len:325 (+),score=79.63 GFUD01080836.1:86-1060(+)